MNGIIDRRLGQMDYVTDTFLQANPTVIDPSSGYSQSQLAAMWNSPDTPLTLNSAGLPSGGSTYGAGYGSSGGITPTEAALLSQGITTAGKVATQDIIGTPTLTYNPVTGTYSATGGATIPASLSLNSSLTEYLPYLLLAGGLFLVLSMRR